MFMQYSLAKAMLSASFTALLSPFLSRTGQSGRLFSAAVGIILYTIVKSIIVECGWGFASAAGIFGGMVAEIVLLGCGIAFFSEVKDILRAGRGKACFRFVGAALFLAGKGLLTDWRVIPERAVFTVGSAAEFALLAGSAYLVSSDGGEESGWLLPAAGAVCGLAAAIPETLAEGLREGGFPLLTPLLMLAGCCQLTVLLADGLNRDRDLSAGGLAAGFMLSYGFDCMTV